MLNLLRQCSRNGSLHLPKHYRQLQKLPELRQTPICHNRILPAFQPCHTFSSSPVNFCQTKDSPPASADGLQKVYYGVLTPQIKAVKVFSLSSSILGVIAQPFLLEQGSKIGGLPMVVALCGFVGFFTFVTPLLLHWITKKYITELHYDEKKDEYVATTVTFFLREKKTHFKVTDVTVPDVPGMFTSFLIGKQAYFLDPKLFPDTDHYIKIMGYDKPIDFKLQLSEEDTSATEAAKKK